MITTRLVIALRPCGPTLTLLRPRPLLEPSVQFFDLPAYVTSVFRDLRRQGLLKVIGNDPVKVAVGGDQLE